MTRVIVVGGGHNALVSAVVLARAGVDVTVLEAEDTAGGCVWTAEVDGQRVERGAVDHGGVAALAADLDLARFGLEYVERDRLMSVVFGDGESRHFEVSAEATAAGFEAAGLGADADAYRGLVRQAGAFFAVLDRFPTPPTPTQLGAALSHLRGGDETFRMLLSSAEAVLERTFTDPHLRASLAMYAAHGQIPPWSGGSGMLALLLPASHDAPAVRPVGGSGRLVTALVAALGDAGGVLRTGAHVARVSPVGDAFEIELRGGERLVADRVVSTLDVRRTTAVLDRPPAAMVRAAAGVTSGRLNVTELTIGLVGGPELAPAQIGGPTGALCFVQDGLDDLRRGFGDVVAGRLPTNPWAMVARTHTDDPAATSLWVSSVVPLHPADGPWDAARERAAADRVLETVSRVLGTDLAAHARGTVVTGPSTWGARLRSDGNPNHLDLSLDQMMGWRPPGMAGHRTPVTGLYLAGAGTHPGGGLSGASGKGAATALLADLRGGRAGRRGGAFTRPVREVAGLWAGLQAYLAMRGADEGSF